VASWDDVQNGIANTPDAEVRIGLDDGRTVVLPIHPDALEERVKASQALQPFRSAVVGQVLPGKPAAKVGVQAGDTIVQLGPRRVEQWYDLLEILQGSDGKPMALEVGRSDGRHRLEVRPEIETIKDLNGKDERVGRIGVGVANTTRYEPLSLGEAVVEGWHSTVEASTQIVRTVRGLFSGRISKREVGGPILIGQLAGESARLGFDAFLAFMALISINLAVLNLLPVPMLDGGHLFFFVIEAILGRPLSLQKREAAQRVGFVLLMLLMVYALYNDLVRIDAFKFFR
jgi:regulator of sigma E protease